MNILDDGTTTPDTPNTIEMYWQKGDGIGALRAQTEVNAPLLGDRNAYGTLKAPMQAANFLDGNFVGPGNWYTSYHAEGTFSVYGDLNCKNPV